MFKKQISLFLSLALMVSALAGCGSGNNVSSSTDSSSPGTETAEQESAPADDSQAPQENSGSKYEEFLTIDVFDSHANYQGIQSGWFGEIVKQKFNMELNIIAPNVAGGGDTLFQTRSTAGNVGDIIFTPATGGRLQDMVTAGLIIDLSDYMKEAKNLEYYSEAIDYTSSTLVEEPGKWCVPSEVSKQSATTPLGGLEPNDGAYIRWDLYKELGYPEISTLEDLLPVMQQMQELCPTSDSGKKTYAFSLFSDWDGDYMLNACAIAHSGLNYMGFVADKVDASEDPVDILDENSDYLRTLRFLNKANQMGLVDPESTSQNYDTLYSKYQDGQVLYSIYSWYGPQAYNTDAHISQGKGMMLAEVKDQQIRNWGCYSKGNSGIVAMVGSKAKDPQRMVDFLDWLYSPEGIACGRSRYCGPEGVLYEIEDGEPILTDLGKQCFFEGDGIMPEEYGGGSWKDGSSQLEYKIVSDGEANPETSVVYNPTLWKSYNESFTNDVIVDWQTHMGANNSIEFLTEHNEILTSPGVAFSMNPDSTEIATLRTQCGSIISEYSWKAVFAETDEQCESLIAEMKEIAKGLGYDDVVAADMESTMSQREVWASVR